MFSCEACCIAPLGPSSARTPRSKPCLRTNPPKGVPLCGPAEDRRPVCSGPLRRDLNSIAVRNGEGGVRDLRATRRTRREMCAAMCTGSALRSCALPKGHVWRSVITGRKPRRTATRPSNATMRIATPLPWASSRAPSSSIASVRMEDRSQARDVARECARSVPSAVEGYGLVHVPSGSGAALVGSRRRPEGR